MNCEDNSKELLKLKNCIKINVQQPDTCIKINAQGVDRCIKVNSNYSGNCCTPIPIPEFEYIDSGHGEAEYHNQDNQFFSYEHARTTIRITNLSEIIDSGLNWSIATISTPEIDLSTGNVSFDVPYRDSGNITLNSYGFGVTFSDDCGNFADRIVRINVEDENLSVLYYENIDGTNGWKYLPNFKYLFHDHTEIRKIIVYNIADEDNNWDSFCRGCSSLEDFSFDEHADTSILTQLNQSWQNCNKLTSFPSIDTSNVYNFSETWAGCSGLVSFPFIDTSKGVTLYRMCQYCSGLTSFPLIDTSSATSLFSAWQGCSGLTSFPLINTSKAVELHEAWSGCSSLTSFPLIDTSSAVGMGFTWQGCSGLTSFPLIDTSNVTNMAVTWYGCSSLTSFPLLNTSKVLNIGSAWSYCSSLTSFPQIDTSSVSIFDSTWKNCSSLTSFPLINVSSATKLDSTWYGCSSLSSMAHIDTSTISTFFWTWINCNSLPTEDCDGNTGQTFRRYLYSDGSLIPSGDGKYVDCGS